MNRSKDYTIQETSSHSSTDKFILQVLLFLAAVLSLSNSIYVRFPFTLGLAHTLAHQFLGKYIRVWMRVRTKTRIFLAKWSSPDCFNSQRSTTALLTSFLRFRSKLYRIPTMSDILRGGNCRQESLRAIIVIFAIHSSIRFLLWVSDSIYTLDTEVHPSVVLSTSILSASRALMLSPHLFVGSLLIARRALYAAARYPQRHNIHFPSNTWAAAITK